MRKSNDESNHPNSQIEPGDIVRWTKENSCAWMKVEAIEGDQAICTYRKLDSPLDGDKRPTALVPTQAYFPLVELEIQRGH